MSKMPAFQFYPADWRKSPDIQAMSYFDRGVWFEILCLMHESDERGRLLLSGKPMNNEALARILGLSKSRLSKTLDTILDFGVAFRDDSGALCNRRMMRDERLRQVRTEAGKQGGNPNLVNQKVKQKPTPSSSSSSSSSITKNEEDKEEEKIIDISPSAQPKTKGTRLPDQFFLTAEMKAYAAEKRPDVDVILETEKFCNFFRAAPGQKGVKLNWQLTWKNWILNAGQYGKSAQRNGNGSNGKRSNADVLDEWAQFAKNIE
jgi:uncharacterized protein YdaU (DUF1376 family)